MRLINTETLDLKEFYGARIPKYAILSHTWEEDEEVTLGEWKSRDQDPSVIKKSGFIKILKACERAREDSHNWLWVDTNCIDKTSSAELTEAINSMYAWYSKSEVCYAYLTDVSTGLFDQTSVQSAQFQRSRWFTRGWTLQELLAPSEVIFFCKGWTVLGDRTTLAMGVEIATGIPYKYLHSHLNLSFAAVSEKMTWLSSRTTTRVEDLAYCMLGLFDVNMPLLYGEGMKAFTRLQEEIVKISTDHTIFCWKGSRNVSGGWAGMLAPSPDAFANSREYLPAFSPWKAFPYSMTNMGLSIRLPVIYTLTYTFVVLNTHLVSASNVRTCVAVRQSDAVEIHNRHTFPDHPLELDYRALNRLEHSHEVHLPELLIRSKRQLPIGFHRPIFLELPETDRMYPLLLFVHPTPSGFLYSGSEHDTRKWRADGDLPWTCESGRFDRSKSILYLQKEKEEAPCHMYSGMISLSATSAQESWSFFFAVTRALNGRDTWYCSVAHKTDFAHMPQRSDNLDELSFILPEDYRTPYYRFMVEETWAKMLEGQSDQRMARSLDGSLTLQIGGPIESLDGTRAASISGVGEVVTPA